MRVPSAHLAATVAVRPLLIRMRAPVQVFADLSILDSEAMRSLQHARRAALPSSPPADPAKDLPSSVSCSRGGPAPMWSPGTSPPSAVAPAPSVNSDGGSGEDLGADAASSDASADAWTQTGADNGVGGWAGEPGAGGGGAPACHGGGHPVVKVTELQARHRHLAQKLSNRPSKEVLVQKNILKGGQGAPHLPRILQESQLFCRMSCS